VLHQTQNKTRGWPSEAEQDQVHAYRIKYLVRLPPDRLTGSAQGLSGERKTGLFVAGQFDHHQYRQGDGGGHSENHHPYDQPGYVDHCAF
jgi:hypothetical protein